MTTRRNAETLLFTAVFTAVKATTTTPLPDLTATSPRLTRRRVRAYYCERCNAWADVLLTPVRLRCVACGLEARP